MPFPEIRRSGLRIICGTLALSALGLIHSTMNASFELIIEGNTRFADARSMSQATLRTAHPVRKWLHQNSWFLPTSYVVDFDAEAMERLGVQVWAKNDGGWLVQAGTREGRLPITLWHNKDGQKIFIGRDEILFRHNVADQDEDGLPDVIELKTENERSEFTRWFTAIAEAQATRIDDRWAKIHQDCAGLVRFAYREAMRTHDKKWLSTWKYLPSPPAARYSRFAYPDLPIVGDKPFRSRGGVYEPAEPVSSQFSAAPNARTLWQHNTSFISKDIAQARAGDLLFFRVPDATGSRLHTMIALGKNAASSHHDHATRVVYHTGQPVPLGEVRLVGLQELKHHPDPSWHPVPSNPRFIGVHRLSHLVFEAQSNPQFAWDSRQRSHP